MVRDRKDRRVRIGGRIMIDREAKDKGCENCIIEGTEACPYGSGKRSIDDEICESFIGEGET